MSCSPVERPLRIGMVCYPSIGGSGIVATDLGLRLYCRGHHIHFMSYDIPERLITGDDGKFAVDCENENGGSLRFHHIEVPNYPLFRFPPYTIALATSLYRIVLEQNLDLVHVHYAIPHSTSALLAKSMLRANVGRTLKIITTLHGTDSVLVGQEPNYKETVEFSINGSDAVTAVSNSLRDQTLEMFRITRDVRVIYNMIDTDTFYPGPEEDEDTKRVPTLVHISNFRPVKRVCDAIKAFDLISRVVPARLLMVGDGPDKFRAEQLAGSLGIADRVTFAGFSNNVGEMLRQADLLLSTSQSESFGLSLAEAMACQLPVVAYRVGGIPEVVDDGVTGALVPEGNVALLAEAAIKVLRCPQLRGRMGRAGHRRVATHFSPQAILPRYEALYAELVSDNGEAHDPLES